MPAATSASWAPSAAPSVPSAAPTSADATIAADGEAEECEPLALSAPAHGGSEGLHHREPQGDQAPETPATSAAAATANTDQHESPES